MMSTPDHGPTRGEPCTCHTARMTTQYLQPPTTLVTAEGELDAVNAHPFVAYALGQSGRALIVDLTNIRFFGTAAFSAIHTLNVQCAGSGVEWILVPGPAVRRLLRVCDPDGTLPVAPSVDAALTVLHREAPPLLQLVPELGQ